ncbi:MAG: hypothetical protein RL722_503, partial [Pseudomonadota bacterium]
MTPSDVSSLTAQLLWAVFLLAAVYGAIGQRTHFCTMGAISDVVNLGDWTRMRMWAAAIAVTLITFNALVALGLADAGRTIYGGPRLLWASTLVGGALFGFGMVLASGCGSRTLVRIGSGNLKSLVVLLVMGLAAWITLKGLTAVWRVNTLDKLVWQLPAGQDLPSLLAHAGGLARGTWAAGLAAVLGGGLLIWALADAEARKAGPLLGGLGSGVVVAGGWWLSGVYGYLP